MKFHVSPKKSAIVATVVTSALSLALAACGGSTTGAASSCTPGSNTHLPKLSSVKTVGFSQNALDGAWRNAESSSMKTEVEAKGWKFVQQNANNSDDTQVQDINTLISDKVDVLVVAPHTTDAEVAAIIKARQQCIPVFLVDRDVNHSTATVGKDYVTFLGSDFEQQGRTAADQMVLAMSLTPTSTNTIIELLGSTGASPAILRGAGFDEEMAAKAPKLNIVKQTADFDRAKGHETTQSLLVQYPNTTGIYAHNDEMGIGAHNAVAEAGKKPGVDIKIVSIDGTKEATTLIAKGEYNAVVESNPHFGKITVQAIQDYMAGNDVPAWIVVKDRVFLQADGTAASYASSEGF